jgi:hypothetical protein
MGRRNATTNLFFFFFATAKSEMTWNDFFASDVFKMQSIFNGI